MKEFGPSYNRFLGLSSNRFRQAKNPQADLEEIACVNTFTPVFIYA
jgi:hypothetical protein